MRGGGGASRSHYFDVISLENLFFSWDEFKKGKEKKPDVQEFAMNLEDNLFELHHKLLAGTYQHSPYVSFFIQDPKLRHIHKASVVDRILHHAIMRIIEPIFEPGFIFDSYSSRKNKGTHAAVARFQQFARKLSRNNARNVWVLQCDIRRFFDSVDHEILKSRIAAKIHDEKVLALISDIIGSFSVTPGKGMPLGNVTSQLFSNIYMNTFDQFIKRALRIHYYIRYADDFLVISRDKKYLETLISQIGIFLKTRLALDLHPGKISIKKWRQGIDFLGYVNFPHHAVVRTKTKRRLYSKMGLRRAEFERSVIDEFSLNQSLQSYLGILKHCRGHDTAQKLNKILDKRALGEYNSKNY